MTMVYSPSAQTGDPGHAVLLAHVLVGKYCDHLPLYRQSEIYSRDKVDLHRSTLTVNGGAKAGHWGGAKAGQFGARALELAALK